MELDLDENVSDSLELPQVLSPEVPDGAVDLFPDGLGRTIFHLPDKDLILKVGFHLKMSEAEAMRLVARNTSIPVPKVYESYIKDDLGYIIMSRVDGEPLARVWKTLDENKRAFVVAQLKSFMEELEQVQGGYYGALWDLPSEDIFFKHMPWKNEISTYAPYHPYGPYYSRSEYNEGLIEALENSRPTSTLKEKDQALARELRSIQDNLKVFSHGDIHPGNIFVNTDGRVTGIIDWEGAGFSVQGREYFETKSRARDPEWSKAVHKIFRQEAQVHYTLFQKLNRELTIHTGA